MARALQSVPKMRAVPIERTATFTVNATLLEELGERLVSKPEIALAELIKNSYDADARTCLVEVREQSIIVADDGHGMTEDQFLKQWMVISARAKGVARFSRLYRRAMAGSKGIGRFSARFLGEVVTLSTVAIDARTTKAAKLTAIFDWRKITPSAEIDEIEIAYTVEPSTEAPGTTLAISELREEARRTNAAKVRTEILRLTDPYAGLERPGFFHEKRATQTAREKDPGFSLKYSDADTEDEQHAELPSETLQGAILNQFVGRVRIAVENGHTLRYEVYWQGREKPATTKVVNLRDLCRPYTRDRLPKAVAKLQGDARASGILPHQTPVAAELDSPLLIDVRFFPRRAGVFQGLGVDGRVAYGWITEQAGFSVIDNGFPMAAYAGQENDWLEINKSKAQNERNWQSLLTTALYPMSPAAKTDPAQNPMLALPRGTQLVGRVYIATRGAVPLAAGDQQRLQPNMDREGLRDNDAFRLVWHIARFAAELLGHFDRKFRLREEERKAKRAQDEADKGLSQAISEIRASDDIAPEYKERIVSQLRKAQSRYAEYQRYERQSRTSLELLSMMGVMAGFMTHEFEKALHTLGEAKRVLKKAASQNPALRDLHEKLSATELSLAGFMDYSRAFLQKARDPKIEPFKAKGQLDLIVETVRGLASSHHISIEVAAPGTIMAPAVPIAAYNGIALNLISNAMKALVAKVAGGKRLIRLHVLTEGKYHVLVVADNGIGIPPHLQDRIWDPLYTTTADESNPLGSGLGLGLTLVREVVKNLGGRIELLGQAPPGFVTAFQVSLPLPVRGT